jgi:DNA-directed RNA polymerase specialized sigma24 family protein
MRQIAVKRYIEKTRKKRIPSQLTISLEELESISSGSSVEEMCEAKDLGRLITEYVKLLNERQRYVFIDHYYAAEPIEKTASDLSVTSRTVYNDIKKIKHGLKEYLEKNGVHV